MPSVSATPSWPGLRTTWSRLACLASAAPSFLLVVTLVRVWVDPMSVDDGAWVPLAVGIMVLEFLVLHSGGFMGALAVGDVPVVRKVLLFLGLVVMYGLFALGFSVAVGSWAVMKIYGVLMAGRFMTVMAASQEGKVMLLVRSGVGVVAYLGSVFLTLFIPLPRGGLDPSILDAVYPGRGGGEWEQRPETAIAAGVLYFTILGIFELVIAGRRGDRLLAKVDPGGPNSLGRMMRGKNP